MYLDKPCQDEDESDEIHKSQLSIEAVYSSVHQEHPAFLWGCLIHSEETCYCNKHKIKSYRSEFYYTKDAIKTKKKHHEKYHLNIKLLFNPGVFQPE